MIASIGAILLVALACLGWTGYYMEFQQRIKAEEKIKKLYGG